MQRRTHTVLWTAAGILIGFLLFLTLPLFGTYRSMAVMSVYSRMNAEHSIAGENGIRVFIPGGQTTQADDWYPLVCLYNASEEYALKSGTDADLNIYYSFPAFDELRGCSRLYDPSSPYYCGFYGLYLVRGTPCGFDETAVFRHEQLPEVIDVLKFDLFELVLDDFGLTDPNDRIFDYELTEIRTDQSYAGSDGWVRMDAVLNTNGAQHTPDGIRTSYLQYGRPAEASGSPFAETALYGRMYGKYLEEADVTAWFYILTADRDALEETDREILAYSRIEG